MFAAQMVMSDPPVHDRLRQLAAPAFTGKAISSLKTWIEDLVDKRVAELAEMGDFDAVEGLATYVPGSTILHILGIPASDWQPLISRVPGFLHAFSPFPITDDQRAECDEACQFYIDYFGAIVDERRKAPGDDIVGQLITAHDREERLSHIELIALLNAFLNAGYETTMSALGTGLWGMLSQKDPWAGLTANPSAVSEALEETLRWDPPVHFLFRYPDVDLTVEGQKIPAGDRVILGLAAANRDERRFHDPDRIDIRRRNNAHVTFGGGRHFCIGSQLARLEARTTLAAIAKRIPRVNLVDDQLERYPSLMFPAIKRLRLKCELS
jgi:cytochrome P450